MVLLIPLVPLIRSAVVALLLMPNALTALALPTVMTRPTATTVPFGWMPIIPAKEADHVFDD